MKKLFLLCALASSLLKLQAQDSEQYYVKHVNFPSGASIEQKLDMAARLVPTPQQLEWQEMELTAFLHYGINTFTGREWGDGKEDPAIFNPTDFDAEQWIKTLHDAGFKMAIITAKHHDGFCLWPSKYTNHTVASSPWKGGKGDMVKELREACDKYDMKFGVYLSPWDRNAPSYGDSPVYNQYFVDQLNELLTNYGEVHEVWFDGACAEGPNGKKQEYDWDRFYATIQELQPKAVMAIMGDDVRWVGNERGVGRETEWSATVLTPGVYGRADENNQKLNVFATAKDLGSREILENATELFWYPSEVDVSIRPGWFYHEHEDDKVKSLRHLMNIYYESVGLNSVLLLNIPPDRRGLIHQSDSIRLMEFAAYRNKMLTGNLLSNGKTRWTAKPGDTKAYTFTKKAPVNVVLLQEDITKGQRVESFKVEAWQDGAWQEVANGTTVGFKRMVRFPQVETDRIRITINESRLDANICNVAAYYAEPIASQEVQAVWNNQPRDKWNVISTSPLTIDLGAPLKLESFTYAPANGEAKPSMAYRYKLSVSTDGKEWTELRSNGEFSNIMHNPVPMTVRLQKNPEARYIKIEATNPIGAPATITVDEIGVMAVQP